MYPQLETVAAASRRVENRKTGSWALQFQILAALALLTLPAFTSAATALRYVFPAATLVLAAYALARHDYRRYVSLCVWLFILTPEVRRLVDFRAGWAEVNMIMMAPYLCAGLSLGAIAYALTFMRHPVSGGLVTMVAVALYGMLITPVSGTIFAGGFDFLRWVVPPSFGMLIAINGRQQADLRQDFHVLLILALAGTGLYALYQFWYLPAWDAFWMKHAHMNSIGEPRPLLVRTFSTLNSPGSLATFLMIGVAVLIGGPGRLKWIALTIGSIALVLTIVRAAWVGLAVMLLYYLLAAPGRTRGAVILLCIAATLAMPLLLTGGRASRLVTARVETMSDLSSDTSANDRMEAYARLGDKLQSTLLGNGLGTTGTYGTYADGGRAKVVDGGPIEIILKVGLIGAVVYYAGLFALLLKLFATGYRPGLDRDFLAVCRAVVISGLLLQSTSPTTVGEMGFFFWLVVGLGFAMILHPQAADHRATEARAT